MRFRKSIAAVFAAAVAPVLFATAGPAGASEDVSQVDTAAIQASGADNIETKIINGGDATEDYPFIATLLRPDGTLGCSGSLIDENWVLTAAHCVYGDRADNNSLRVGSINGHEGGTVVDFTEIIIHPDYDDSEVTRIDMDIALLRLENPIPDAQPITRHSRGPADVHPARVLGWGQQCTEPGGCGQAEILQELDTIIDRNLGCEGGFNARTELCTNPGPGFGTCYGDSGGPLMIERLGQWELAGVTVRFGYAGVDGASPWCGDGNTISSSVAFHNDWIDSHIA